jgi:tetratricopeptide (TPR) repeat protein
MPTPDELVRNAEELLSEGRLDEAAEAFAEALEQDHEHLPASLALLRLSLALGMVEQATAIAERTLSFAPEDPEALVLRGLIEEGSGRLDAALKLYGRASRIAHEAYRPASPQPPSEMERARPRQAAPEAAQPRRPAVTPQGAYTARYHHGRALAAARRYKEAIPELVAASRLQPNATEPHYAMGIAYKESGRIGEAVGAFTRAIEIDPTFLDGYMTLCDVLSEAEKQDAAERVLLQAQSLYPDVGAVYDKLAAVYLKQGELAKVVETLQQQVRVDPANEEAHVNLVTFALVAKDVQTAAAAVERLIEQHPGSWRGRHLRSTLYDMADRTDLAMADLREAMKLAPQEWKPRNDLGTLLNARAQTDPSAVPEAVEVLEAACKLAPASELAPRYNLALAYWNAGRKPEAQRTAAELVQGGPEGHPVVEQAREVLGAMETAGV